jgi:ABC-type enterochelin transport system substrate-binding protein
MIRQVNAVLMALAAAVLLTACLYGQREQAAATTEAAAIPYADQDRDGKVTRKEAKIDKALQAAFDKYDANDDDVLDRAEFARLEAASGERQQARSDTGGRHELRPRKEFSQPYE